jgi:hypothetical protein
MGDAIQGCLLLLLVILVSVWLGRGFWNLIRPLREDEKRPCWPRPTGEVLLVADDAGFTLARTDGLEAQSFRWDEVDEIETYKWDLWSYNEVSLDLLVAGRWCLLQEYDEGFSALTDAMERRFPDIPERWYADATSPANWEPRTLWKRDRDDESGE